MTKITLKNMGIAASPRFARYLCKVQISSKPGSRERIQLDKMSYFAL